MTSRLGTIWHRHRVVILLAGLAVGLLLGVRASIDRLGTLEPVDTPARGEVVVAVGLLLLGQAAVGFGWHRLVPAISDPVESMWSFHATQPGKYLPFGIGQAVGQVALASDLGVRPHAAIASWASHVAMIVVAGTTSGVLVVANPHLGPLRWFALLGLFTPILVHRSVLERVVGVGSRFTSRLPAPSDLPAQRGLTEAFLSGAVFMVSHGLAFALLLGGIDQELATWIGFTGAYGLAAGLSIASPLPAGLGVREALLVLLTHTAVPATIAAAIVLRVAAFAAEVMLLVIFSVLRRRRAGTP